MIYSRLAARAAQAQAHRARGDKASHATGVARLRSARLAGTAQRWRL